jgi:hypothetical protein
MFTEKCVICLVNAKHGRCPSLAHTKVSGYSSSENSSDQITSSRNTRATHLRINEFFFFERLVALTVLVHSRRSCVISSAADRYVDASNWMAAVPVTSLHVALDRDSITIPCGRKDLEVRHGRLDDGSCTLKHAHAFLCGSPSRRQLHTRCTDWEE